MQDETAETAESVDEPSTASRAAAAGVGTVLGTAMGGPLGAAVGAYSGVALEPLVAGFFAELRRDGHERMARTIQVASDEARSTPEMVMTSMERNERTRLLGGTAFASATRTAYEQKVQALGRALAAGLSEDDARVDEEQMVVSAIADLEAPHVSLLKLLVSYRPGDPYSTQKAHPYEKCADPVRGDRRAWSTGQISSARPNLAPVLPSLLGTLQRHGLATVDTHLGGALEGFERARQDAERLDNLSGRNTGPSAPSASLGRQSAGEAFWSPTRLGETVLNRFTDPEPT